jgi:hypothetical protein
MRRYSRVCLIAVVGAFVFASAVGAQCTTSVSISSISTSSGSITVKGSYSVASGYTLGGVSVQAVPTGGTAGEGGQGTASASSGSFSVTFSVPGGLTYDVQAILVVNDSGGNSYYYYSAISTKVSVP